MRRLLIPSALVLVVSLWPVPTEALPFDALSAGSAPPYCPARANSTGPGINAPCTFVVVDITKTPGDCADESIKCHFKFEVTISGCSATSTTLFLQNANETLSASIVGGTATLTQEFSISCGGADVYEEVKIFDNQSPPNIIGFKQWRCSCDSCD